MRRSTLMALATAGALLAGLLWLMTPARPQSAGIGGPFQLTDGAQKRVTQADYRGKFMLIYFGYTNCPDVCPATLYNIARALKLMGPEADMIQPLFVTIDPARDTPSVMGRYVALFSPLLVGLSGSPAALHAMAQEYHVYVGPMDAKSGAIDHGAMLYLMAPDGSFVSGVADDLAPAALAATLSKFMK